jgi:nitrite reductase/ring-hydroxylating ferredoxin subunit
VVITETEAPQPGKAVRVVAKGRPIAVFNVEGKLCALDAECGHRQGPLEEGEVHDGIVTCPKHHAQYNLRTGEVVGGNFLIKRVSKPVHVHPLRSLGGRIAVEVQASSPAAPEGSSK